MNCQVQVKLRNVHVFVISLGFFFSKKNYLGIICILISRSFCLFTILLDIWSVTLFIGV